MNKQIYLRDLGSRDYKETWDYQTKLLDDIIAIKRNNRVSEVKEVTPNHFLFVEHPHVYTLGKVVTRITC